MTAKNNNIFKTLATALTLVIASGQGVLSVLNAQETDTGNITGQVKNASTGYYLEKARIRDEGTNQIVFTDKYGTYRITGVPSGQTTLSVSYIGLGSREVSVTVESGTTVVSDVILSPETDIEPGEIVELEEFVTRGETDANMVAMNQQRYSINNKVVMDSDAFGDVTEGNIGEFIKFLPGISINYVAADVRSIEVRGLSDNFTPVTFDGHRMASASSTEPNRRFELEQVSLNNVARVEVIKVPTPDMAADSLGGSVNFISKSAFERDGRQIKYRVYASMNSEDLDLGKTPGWGPTEEHKILPGIDFSYSDILAKGRIGFIFNYLNSNQFNEQHRSRPRWDFEEYNDRPEPGDFDGPVPEPSNLGADGFYESIPIMRRYQMQDGPKYTHRESFNVKIDFKVTENTILSSSVQWNDYYSKFRNRNVQWDTNVDERKDFDSSSRAPLIGEISDTANESRVGGGDIDYGSSWRDKFGDTWHADFNIKHYMGKWTFEGGAFWSDARNSYREGEKGNVKAANWDYDVPGKIIINDFGNGFGNNKTIPNITVTDADGNVIPNLGVDDFSKFELIEIEFQDENGSDKFYGVDIDVRYEFKLNQEVPGYVQVGFARQTQDRYGSELRNRLRYIGSEPLLGGDFIDESYSFQDALFFDAGIIQWPDNSEVYQFYLKNKDLFDEGDLGARADDNIISAANDVFTVKETITAAYLMAGFDLFDGKVSILGGLRFEETEIEGNGPLFIEAAGFNSDGTPIGDEVAVFRAQWNNRQDVSSEYNGIYPSLHFRWDVTDKIVVRAAYAKTLGRPNFSDVIPRTVINSPDFDDPDPADGRVQINNTGLQPQIADNLDLSLEYYFTSGGVLSLGLFKKDLSDFIGDFGGTVDQDTINTFNLPDSTLGFALESQINAGSAEIKGVEFNYQQRLDFLPGWASGFTIFANGTYLNTEGDFGGSTIEKNLEGFVRQTANWGFTYDRKRIKFQLRWNQKGEELLQRLGGDISNVGGMLFNDRLQNLDMNFVYRFSKKLNFFVNGRNILIDPQDRYIEAADVPGLRVFDRSEEFGIQWAMGFKGEF